MRPFLLFMALLTNVGGVQAQYDSTYYTSYAEKLTCRFYLSQKYTTFSFRNIENGVTLNYKPNTTLNMGVGATYKWATLNLAYGFGFLNSDSDKGETQYLDLQWHVFARKFTIDMLGQFYKGFYLDNEKVTKALGHYYTRPDLAIYEIGVSSQYILNHRRFRLPREPGAYCRSCSSLSDFLPPAAVSAACVRPPSKPRVARCLSDLYTFSAGWRCCWSR